MAQIATPIAAFIWALAGASRSRTPGPSDSATACIVLLHALLLPPRAREPLRRRGAGELGRPRAVVAAPPRAAVGGGRRAGAGRDPALGAAAAGELISRGRVKRSAKRPSRRSQAMTGGWSCQACEQAEDAGNIVCKSASPWGGVDNRSQRGRISFGYLSMRLNNDVYVLELSTLFGGQPLPVNLSLVVDAVRARDAGGHRRPRAEGGNRRRDGRGRGGNRGPPPHHPDSPTLRPRRLAARAGARQRRPRAGARGRGAVHRRQPAAGVRPA
jgi:hypothetical protein